MARKVQVTSGKKAVAKKSGTAQGVSEAPEAPKPLAAPTLQEGEENALAPPPVIAEEATAPVEAPAAMVEPAAIDPTILHAVDPAAPYTDLVPAMLANPDVRLRFRGSLPLSEATTIGQGLASQLRLQVEVVSEDGEVLQVLVPQDMLVPARSALTVRIKSSDRDWTVKPTINSPANLGITGLLDNIEAARGDLPNLETFIGTFRGSRGTDEDLKAASTYYRLAGRYLWGLINEARAAAGTDQASDEVDHNEEQDMPVSLHNLSSVSHNPPLRNGVDGGVQSD